MDYEKITKRIRFVDSFATMRESFRSNQEYEIYCDDADQYVREGLAIYATEVEPQTVSFDPIQPGGNYMPISEPPAAAPPVKRTRKRS